MADNDVRKLLDYIVTHSVADLEAQTELLNANAIDPAEQVESNIDHEVQTEREASERMLPHFAAALRAAGANRTNGGTLVLDDTDPAQDGMASALARFLVKPNLASAETTENGEGHYRYTFTLDWAALERIAGSAGVDLGAALA